MWAGGSVLDPEQASPGKAVGFQEHLARAHPALGSSRECLGVPDSRLLGAPFLPFRPVHKPAGLSRSKQQSAAWLGTVCPAPGP